MFDYRGPVAAAVVTAKLAGARRGWRPLGRLLAERVATCPPELDAVTWVATAAARRRARGVDHARLLAAEVADRLEVPLLDTLHARAPRHGPDRFTARLRLPGSDLLLVDDVLTTGATASRVAGVLRDAGAGRIHLAVLARAGSHALVDVGATVPPGAPGPDGGVRRVLGPR
ncbi:ComF family protein [Egicoccus halophilus]|uniref:Phosphoribosyltransferase domain-containing protein n=1 Tax=Egicoccus halophilus TaxID=1670830 RepID=A0A8J3ESQ0_9ACTN|nr:phosphoribosyltransferase family protein [Egicoccus halophilus]GGI03924.1 hypothetical protein GCM10011354_06480 [Egicoccus halophilus]